jgi:hypothetical protein
MKNVRLITGAVAFLGLFLNVAASGNAFASSQGATTQRIDLKKNPSIVCENWPGGIFCCTGDSCGYFGQ